MVSIVTVSYNSFMCLARLRQSLRALWPGVDHEWICVDNGSPRGETHTLLDEITASGEATVIRLSENQWFTAGCNAGIAKAGGDKILLLNPDCQAIEAGWLEVMVKTSERPNVGIVGAVLVNEAGEVVHAGAHGMGDHIGKGLPYAKDLPFVRERRLDKDDWVTGACLLVNRQALEVVGGGLGENYPHFHSDRVLCQAVRAAGYEVWLSSAVLVHSVGGSGQ